MKKQIEETQGHPVATQKLIYSGIKQLLAGTERGIKGANACFLSQAKFLQMIIRSKVTISARRIF